MSQETSRWLNENMLIGYAAKRGKAWHYRASDQGAEPNHYDGPIPVEDVRRRLFHWEPAEGDVQTTYVTDSGVTTITDPTRKTIIRPDTGAVFYVAKKGYAVHPYGEWLLDTPAAVLDADLAIGGAGLLRGGGVAYVQVEVEDTLSVEGVDYRPFMTFTTSLDGSVATTYFTGAQVIVCDNTYRAALGAAESTYRVRHTAGSVARLGEARDALGVIHGTADRFAEHVQSLTARKITDRQWKKFLGAYTNVAAAKTDRQKNAAQRLADELDAMWRTDERVSPWKGTAFGAVQAVNTHLHHAGVVRNVSRAERNAERAVTGDIARSERHALALLNAL